MDNVYYQYDGGNRKVRNGHGANKRIWWEHQVNGAWVSGTNGNTGKLLYRLPPVGRVCIVEGEKDVDTLHDLGIGATCNAHGAGKWAIGHSEQLRGYDVVVIPDNDKQGYDHANKVVSSLTGIAKSIRRLHLIDHWPAIPIGGDATDYVDSGQDCAALHQWIDEAPMANGHDPAGLPPAVDYDDFLAYAPQHQYIFRPTGQLWPAATINGRLPWVGGVKPSSRLDIDHPVEQMSWCPGQPTLIKDKLIADGGWIDKEGTTVFNLYRPPHIKPGDGKYAQQWIDHVTKVYPDDADHIIKWFAHRCQFPHVKINHALLLGGSQGVGKDTLLEPVRRAVGYWNCASISPTQLLSRFNGFLKSILLIVSEARDLGEVNRPNFYEHTKAIIAAPPESLLIDEKHTHPYYIPNLTGVIITTNHKAAGVYLPPEDRRHYVAWSPCALTDFEPDYFERMWAFYETGGYEDVAAYLRGLDLGNWNCKAPPPHTAAFDEIVIAGQPVEAGELEDALAAMGNPLVTTIDKLVGYGSVADPDFVMWLRDRKNRRQMARWFELCGYVVVKNPNSKQGLWRVNNKLQTIYGRADLPPRERIKLAMGLV